MVDNDKNLMIAKNRIASAERWSKVGNKILLSIFFFIVFGFAALNIWVWATASVFIYGALGIVVLFMFLSWFVPLLNI